MLFTVKIKHGFKEFLTCFRHMKTKEGSTHFAPTVMLFDAEKMFLESVTTFFLATKIVPI